MIATPSHSRSAWAMTWVEKITVVPFAASARISRFELALVERVEARERLVEHHQPRLVDQRAEQLDGLRHALRQLADLPVGGIAEAVLLEQLAPAPAPFGQRQPAQRAEEGDRLVRLHRRIEPALLGQVADQRGRYRAGRSWPSTRRTPSSGSMMPSSMRSVVVLPAPFGPSMP